MINHFCKKPLWECSRALCDVAAGRRPADTVIRHATLVNVCTHELIPDVDVAVSEGRIALVGDCARCIGEKTVVVDAAGKYLAPAFMDGHIHIESSMLTASEYAKAVLPHGTSGIFMDPHEICNVLGLRGVRYMLNDAAGTPLKAFLTTPSCVPAVPGFEDTGAEIHPEDVAKTMKWKECVGLGEMMNFPGILSSDEHTHAIVGETLKAGKIPTGHYSVPETGNGLNAYVASGVRCCHESTREEDALAKMRLGMYAMLREGSAWHDLKEVGKAITRHEIDARYACLVSDDTHPHTLIERGHLDHIVRRAIEEGVDPITAIQMVTINVAQCFRLDHEMGSVAPSKCADLVLLSDLNDVTVTDVWVDGEHVAHNGVLLAPVKPYVYPRAATNSIKLTKKCAEDFVIPCKEKDVKLRVIRVIPARTSTLEDYVDATSENGRLVLPENADVLKAFVFDRHTGKETFGYGFIGGFGIRNGALAQTVAHDAHNLIVVGTNDEDMALAVNALIDCKGGLVAVRNGEILGRVELPIAGLMSEKPLTETSEQVERLENAWREMGCALPSPFMTMSIVSLACLPDLRLTNRGLVDCRNFTFTQPILR